MDRPARLGPPSWIRPGILALGMAVVAASTLGRIDRGRPTPSLAPSPIPACSFSPPGIAFLDGNFLQKLMGDPCVIDLHTGEVGRSPLPENPRLDLACPSPYVDASGRRQLIGRELVRCGEVSEYILARYELPAGRLVDRIQLEVSPLSRPCWDGAGHARIFYIGVDGGFHRVDYGGAAVVSVAKVAWTAGRVGPGSIRHAPLQVCWYGDANTGGYLIVTMASSEKPPANRCRLWWLRLDPAGRSIEEAGLLIGSPDPGWNTESCPAVSPSMGRTSTLAFLATPTLGDGRDLYTASIRMDPATGRPRVNPAELRLAARDCGPCPPTFSPDGRHLFYLPGTAGPPRFIRHEVAY